MLDLDIRTLSFLAMLSALLLALGMQVVNRVIANDTSFRLWADGATALAAGYILVAARGVIPDLFSIVVANTLLVAGAVWQYLGNRAFQGRKSEFPWYWLLVAAVAALFYWFTYQTANLSARIVVVSAALGAVRLASALVLLRRTGSDDGIVRLFLAGAYLLAGVFLGARAAINLIAGPTDQDFMAAAGLSQTFAFVVEIGLAIVLGIGLPLLVLGRTQQRLISSEAHLKAIIQNEPECIKVVDAQGLLVQMNPAGLAMIEADSWEQVKGAPVLEIVAPQYREAFMEMHKRVIAGEQAKMEFEVVGLKGGRRMLETHAVPMKVQAETVQLAVTRDITQRKQMEDQRRQLAFHDSLTDLPNRRLLLDRLNQAMAASKRSGCNCALIFLDLDNFKPLNDKHGHAAGDLLLIEVARRLTNSVRKIDAVSRFGGDEFAVLLSVVTADEAGSVKEVGTIAEKIRVKLAEPYLIEIGHTGNTVATVEHRCSASIGVVVFKNHECSQEDILRRADAAMYKAKDAGRNAIVFHQAHSEV